ncbi:lipid-A-disaccharide synthase [Rhodobacteraceae bacterium HSP-20]|uniref:Lipid-A-disaccharide synthase n=1 Tax=Paragemmobacter amnigenus TaxID=2852097 RepID=A0ABS6IXW8_9RHOB|nr:lipid-A-disaccharide synthase [Rhodobacter amnigenus]MBU9696366.1 lipid-A-disaccharide synthase [Rhodobacter amnigenus]MBV4387593.1 lipid-A-disaccharide synthase [Rhodobacter amnigenus]
MKIFLVAGEPSGDRLGAALMAGLRSLRPDVEFAGVAGPLMQAQGMASLFPMEELSVMGIAEVIPKYLHLKRRIREVAEAVVASGAEALVTIDSPDFGLRVAALVKAAKPAVRTIHYVAPSVWAWRPGRAAKMARHVDHVLALLPFEPPYMQAAGMSCDFVGHPVVAEALASGQERAAWAGTGPLVLALPGSRRGEVSRLMPVLGEVVGRLAARHPGLRVALPTVRGVAGQVAEMAAGWPVAPVIVEEAGAKRGAFAAADVAVAASGTVSLELAANGCPMVIAYDMHPLTLWLMRRAALVDTVTLVNLVSETRVVPEFIGDRCRAELIAPAVEAVLADPSAQDAAMRVTMERLGAGGEPPGLRAARSVLGVLG